jgi:PAS domain S-box-containing protein
MSGFAARQGDPVGELNRPLIQTHGGTLVYALLVGVSYFLAAKIGFALTFQPNPVSALWPPNAVLLAALLLAPRRLWPVLLLAAFPAHLAVELESGVPILMILCWFVSNSSEALLGAICLRSFTGGPPRFDRFQHVIIFITFAIIAPFVTSFLDAAFVALIGWGGQGYWHVWQMRFFSNVLAELTIVPVIITVAVRGIEHWQQATFWRMIEAGLLTTGLISTCLFAFWHQSGELGIVPALVYAPLPFLLWASVRFGPRGVSASLLAIALLAIRSAVQGRGPFSTMSQTENVLSLQIFLVVMTLPLMLLAAVIEERRETERALRESQQRYALATAASGVGVWERNPAIDQVYVDPTITKMLGSSPREFRTHSAWLSRIHPEDIARVEAAGQAALESADPVFDMEYRMFHQDGSVRWIHLRWAAGSGEGDGPRRLFGTIADITERKQAEETLRHSEEALRESNERIRDLAGRLIAAQEEERKRIARDLHDDLNQQLAALTIGLSTLERQIPEPSGPLHEQIIILQDQAAEIMGKIRELSHGLHSTILEYVGLPEALNSFCEEFQNQGGPKITLKTQGKISTIPADIGLCLYRVLQESLRNVAKHSGATSAEVILTSSVNSLELHVADKGVGFNLEEVRSHHGLGLVSMQERVHLLQGDLQIKTRPGNGTELHVRVPLGSKP